MKISLSPKVQKLVDRRVKSGVFATREEFVAAAVMSLEQQADFGDFRSGEMDQLLAEGERSLRGTASLDGDEAFRRRRRDRAKTRSGKSK